MSREIITHHHQLLGKPWDTSFYFILQKKSKSKDCDEVVRAEWNWSTYTITYTRELVQTRWNQFLSRTKMTCDISHHWWTYIPKELKKFQIESWTLILFPWNHLLWWNFKIIPVSINILCISNLVGYTGYHIIYSKNEIIYTYTIALINLQVMLHVII